MRFFFLLQTSGSDQIKHNNIYKKEHTLLLLNMSIEVKPRTNGGNYISLLPTSYACIHVCGGPNASKPNNVTPLFIVE